jgi:shikimate kinase
MTTKIILTGFMATGKSAVGHLVAKQLGWRFTDTDQEIVARAGKPIATIFAEHGEAHFRALEHATIAMLADDPRLCPQSGNPLPEVISTGGGALVDEENCAMLKRAGIVMCLTARPEVIAARVGRSVTRRPKLLEGNQPLEQRIRDLMAERAVAYARADVTIDTSDLSPAQVADRIIDALVAREYSRCKPSA